VALISGANCTFFLTYLRKTVHLYRKDATMYRGKDRQSLPLFKELFPFGGQLDSDNRWLKIAQLIPWDDIETRYSKYFSDKGRPASDCRLVNGLLMLQHMTKFADDAIIVLVSENPYMQFFCGFDQFVTKGATKEKKKLILDSSTLSKARKRLGKEFFAELEQETYEILVERKLIRGKGMLLDATVFPE
jgi:IS5 family transposase